MWVFILFFALFFSSIVGGLIHLIKKYYERRIKNAASIDECVSLRKRVLRAMHCIIISSLLIGFIIVWQIFVFQAKNDKISVSEFWRDYLLIVIAFVYVYVGLKKGLNVSVFKKEQFLAAYPSFVLYLRAFSTDDYNARTNKSLSWSAFSEDEFVRSLRGLLPVCAIGMTKECVAPRGAMRVYVSDTTWQADVRELMEKAEVIVILVDDRPSCLWEIVQSSDLLEKTALIVVDREKYESVRVKVEDNLALPVVADNVSLPFSVYGSKNDVTKDVLVNGLGVFPFKNSLKGYDALWDHLLEAGMNKRRRKKWREGWIFRCLSIWFSVRIGFLKICAYITIAMMVIGCFLKGGIWSAIATLALLLLIVYFFWDEIIKRLKRK